MKRKQCLPQLLTQRDVVLGAVLNCMRAFREIVGKLPVNQT